ncbi:hypothetical protein [Streptomyces sp. NPDC018833]|uniref:hypothetical protein n=1 Tax=Streptomyces sp. NPDC018833 TaxID=3365053 RepID=UPI0037A5E177
MRQRTVRITAAAFTVAGLFLTTACDGDKVEHGTVIDKHHRPQGYIYQQQPIKARKCDYRGANCRLVNTGRHRTVQIFQSECWKLTLKAKDGETGSLCVSVEEYNKFDVGDKR